MYQTDPDKVKRDMELALAWALDSLRHMKEVPGWTPNWTAWEAAADLIGGDV